MRCEDVARLLFERAGRTGGAALPLAVNAHLAECLPCASLNRTLENGGGNELPEQSMGEIVGRISSTLEPVKLLPPTGTLVLQTTVIFVLLPALIAVAVGAPGLDAMQLWVGLTLLAGIACAEIFLSFSLISLMVPGCRLGVEPLIRVAACPLLFAGTVWSLFPSASTGPGWHCLLVGVSGGVPAALGLWFLARRGAVLDWMRAGSVLGVLGALVGVTVLVLGCENLDRGHQAFWHGGVLVAGAVTGFLLGRLNC